MKLEVITWLLAYVSGVVSTLSPCVLPLLPIVLGSAVSASRYGAVALTAGVMLSFSAIGMLLATAGATLGLNEDALRNLAAVLLVVAGIVLMTPAIQRRVAVLAGGASDVGHGFLARLKPAGGSGQFVIGLVLGVVWSPCVGPTLGAATVLAAQGKNWASDAVLMALYGLGAGTPMLLLGTLSRALLARMRGRLLMAGTAGKYLLGGALCVLGVLTLSGLDKTLETIAVAHSPAWLIDLTTRI